MDCVGTMMQGGFDDFIDAEVAFRRGRGTQVRGFVGHADGERGSVGIGVDGYARDVHFAESANEADGDFTAIGDQDLAEHKGPIVAGSGSFEIESDDGSAPASGFHGGVAEGFYEGSALQNLANGLALDADSAAMDDTDGGEFQAVNFEQILLDDGFYVAG
jgi:hypothetical protein